MSIPEADYDGAWKEALETYLPESLALLAPALYAVIDWSKGFVFLDTELQAVTGTAAIGVRAVDKLVRVWLRDGTDAWILIHIEAQHQRDTDFPRRVFIYHVRLVDQYDRPVVSLAILGDADPGWRPSLYQTEVLGCAIRFQFPVIKLLDYRARLADLAEERNHSRRWCWRIWRRWRPGGARPGGGGRSSPKCGGCTSWGMTEPRCCSSTD